MQFNITNMDAITLTQYSLNTYHYIIIGMAILLFFSMWAAVRFYKLWSSGSDLHLSWSWALIAQKHIPAQLWNALYKKQFEKDFDHKIRKSTTHNRLPKHLKNVRNHSKRFKK